MAERPFLPVCFCPPTSLIGTDPVDEDRVLRVCEHLAQGFDVDPVLIYEHRGARFIIEGNHRAYACRVLGRDIPCLVVRYNGDFEKLRQMPVHLGNIARYEHLQQVHDALAAHLRSCRADIYAEYFGRSRSFQSETTVSGVGPGAPRGTRSRFQELIDRRDTRELSRQEHEELMRLTDEIEYFDARRAELLAELARRRRVTLSELMDQLQIAGAVRRN